MLNKKLVQIGLTIAMTTSMSLLAGCPIINVVPESTPTPSSSSSEPQESSPATIIEPTSSASGTPSTGGSSSPSTGSSSSTSNPSSSASPSGVPSPSPTPNNTTSDTSDKATFNGIVYNTDGLPVDGAKVTAVSIDTSTSWTGESQITSGGAYVFKNAPVGVRILVTASKDGWTSRSRTEVLKSNLTGDPDANKIDFEGRDSIQDEPEVTSLKINDRLVTGAGKILTGTGDAQRPTSTTSANLTSLDSSNLKFDFAFSEAIDQEDFENGFMVKSQGFQRDGVSDTFYTDIDSGLNEITFDWGSDRKSVVVRTNKPVLAQKTADEAKYNLYLENTALTDDDGKNAFTYDASTYQGIFRFSSKTTSDNIVFSIDNDDKAPVLSSVSAKSGGGSNDLVELKFSEPLEVLGHTSPLASLNYNGTSYEDFSTFFYTHINTIVGDTSKTVFTFSQLLSSSDSSTYFPITLDNSIRSSETPATTSSPTVKKVKLEGNKLSIEFVPNSLISGLKLLVSVGKNPTLTTTSLPNSSV
ncbi:MAG: carboxypeptidase-like regulatory domain-containing protein [Candidatus Sericytochromatia bacterium]